jgi:threonine/homoserine/homoserine lactone efflux protein
MLNLFCKGCIIGFSIAAPVGPIGLLCINRSLYKGWQSGFVSGCGAAMADGTYGIIAGFGLTFIASFLISHVAWIKMLGALFLFYIAFNIIRAKPPTELNQNLHANSLFSEFLTTFLLTLTNPTTILSFVAIFAGLGLGNIHTGYVGATIMTLGIVIGSLAWWLILSTGVVYFIKNKLNMQTLIYLNWFSGGILMVFAILALTSMAYN